MCLYIQTPCTGANVMKEGAVRPQPHLTDVISVRTTHWGAQPDLLVGSLLVEDVSPVLAQLHRQHSVRQLSVAPAKLVMVLYQLTEPVTDALEGLVGQLQVAVLVYIGAEGFRETQLSDLTRFDVRQ